MIEIDEEGNFIDATQLLEAAGPEHKDFKGFVDVKNIAGLAKVYADTKSAFGKKLEGVIQKPTKDAKPEDIAAYRAAIASELGVATKPEELELTRPTLPPEYPYDEVMEKEFKQFCIEHKIPKEYAKAVSDWYNARQGGVLTAFSENNQKQYKADVELLEKDWAGDAMPTNLRMVFKAVQEFGDDNLKKQLADAKLYDNPKQLDVWTKLLGGLNQLRIWERIGKRILGSKPLPNIPGGGGGELTQRQKDMRDFPNSPETWAKE